MDDALLLFDADSVLMCMYVCRWLIRHGAWETGYGEMAIWLLLGITIIAVSAFFLGKDGLLG